MAIINRRQFLHTLLGLSASVAIPSAFTLAAPENVPFAPPAVMLHSRHWRILPELLDGLAAEGYAGITYRDWEQVWLGAAVFPIQPVILSVDDLSLHARNPTFDYFRRMKNTFVEKGFRAVFSVITRPDLPQDHERWTEAASWVAEGIELANHTAYHSNLDNPRWLPDDYHTEIVDSTAMIGTNTGHPVRTLVTPFGSGYDLKTGTLNPNVLKAARQADLRFIIGISTGQRHVHLDIQDGDLIYAGRANPGDQHTVNDALYYVRYW